MQNNKKKFYVTTAIDYVNADPHLGHALEKIQADVIARYHRLLGEDVFFLTGTDEHGVKIVKAAEEKKKTPEELAKENTQKFKELCKILNISNDDFIKTSDQKKHWPAVKKVWLKLKENGDIYKKKYRGLYCSGCETFITKKDLINDECVLHRQKPEPIEEENYFFKLSKYSKEIGKAIQENSIKVIPETRKNEILSFIKQGLEDVSFSRPRKDLKWGIPVPDDETQTIYVWADALTNYISSLGYDKESPEFKKYWPADVHCIGKDILRFHAAIWPGILMSLGLELPKNIFVHGFISVGRQKMSKSLGNVIDPFELVKKYSSASSPQAGTDSVRYFLLREIPPAEDGDFTYEKFEKRYNADLSSGLGNLVARILTLAEKNDIKPYTSKIIKPKIDETWQNYRKFLDEFKFNETLSSIWELISFCDKYIEKEKPWKTKDSKVIHELLFALSNIASLLQPFLPETSEKIFQQLGIDPKKREKKFKPKKGKSLFPRL